MHVTLEQIKAALADWETQAREGDWPERLDLSPEQVAENNAEFLWGLLEKHAHP